MDLFTFDLCQNGIKYFDNGIDNPKNGSNDAEVEAGHADIDMSFIGILADVVGEYEYFYDDDAEGVDNFDEDFGFAAVDVFGNEVEGEGEVAGVEGDEEVDLDESGGGVGEAECEEEFVAVVEDVVHVGYGDRHVVVLQQILVDVLHVFVASLG